MKVLFINSSYRQFGNTEVALSSLGDILQQNNLLVDHINIAHKNIQTCHGCRICFDRGEIACPLHDDLLELFTHIQSVDILVIGSPIYVEDINGILKNWIDRMAFNCHRPLLFDKKAFILCTSGTGASGHGMKTVQRALQTWGIQTIGKAQFITGAKIEKAAFEEQYRQKIERIANKITRSVNKYKKPSLIAIMTFQIQKMYYLDSSRQDTYDYKFWKEKGWLEKEKAYYTEEKIGTLKAKSAMFLGKLIMKFVLN